MCSLQKDDEKLRPASPFRRPQTSLHFSFVNMQGRPPAPWTGPSGPQQAMPGPQSGYAGAFGQPPPLAPIAPGSIAGLFSSSIAAPRTGIAFQPTAAVAPVAAVAPNPLHCAPCDKTFVNAAQLATHAATHVQCSVCAFKAAKKVVSLHEEEIHGRIDVEVPPQYRVGKLDTPEEIAKWIEERKKNYPTEANVARKKEEAVKAGEKRKREQEELGPICNYFARGRCTRGDACKYRHEVHWNFSATPFLLF